MVNHPLTAAIVDFLRRIGIECELAELAEEDCFLPGIRLERGRLLVDRQRLLYPGDLLHEAGHLAVVPPAARSEMSGASTEVAGIDMATAEVAAVPWSYAAALAAGVDPAAVFHDGGYRGHGKGLLFNFSIGAPVGVHLLEEIGLTLGPSRARELGAEPYPHMLRWLRA
jgi:hypothetical protein